MQWNIENIVMITIKWIKFQHPMIHKELPSQQEQ